MSADPYEIPKTHIPVPERLTYIPSWYAQHTAEQLSLPVLDDDDGMLGFTIAEVLPERRWAITADGHLLPQHTFEQRYKQWIERVLTPNGVVELKRFNKYFNVDIETVPGVDDFVDAKPDPSMPTADPRMIRYVAIAYNSLEADAGRRKIRPIYTHTGEKVGAAKVAGAAPEGFTPVAPKVAKPPKEEPTETMPCGKVQKVRGKSAHLRFCRKCKEVTIEAQQTAADATAA